MTSGFRPLNLLTADKRQLRGAIWDLPAGAPRRGLCVVLNGHTEFIEKYGEVADELRARGFEVITMDWRGQGASERRVYGNRAGHVGSFDEYDHDLWALLQQAADPMQRAAAAPVPTIALAHSMGAHVLLRHLHDNHRRFACAVMTAPMLDVRTGKFSSATTRAITTILNLRRPSPRFVFGFENRDPLDIPFEDNRVTSDRGRFERMKRLLRAQPFIRINGPTFGWLGAAFSSMQRVKRKSFAEAVTTPLLVFGAGRDRIVPTEAVRNFVKQLPNARYVEIEEAEHEILMENDAIRARFWAEFDAFISQHVPAAAASPVEVSRTSGAGEVSPG